MCEAELSQTAHRGRWSVGALSFVLVFDQAAFLAEFLAVFLPVFFGDVVGGLEMSAAQHSY